MIKTGIKFGVVVENYQGDMMFCLFFRYNEKTWRFKRWLWNYYKGSYVRNGLGGYVSKVRFPMPFRLSIGIGRDLDCDLKNQSNGIILDHAA